jgi:CRISPR/Cas system CSM-associated protein Csm3 (group 7 of RAMP superfamily)
MSKLYRTLFLGRLVQDSALSIGGVEEGLSSVDSPFCRDGQAQFTIRGSGLAGALLATLRRLCLDLPKEITGIHKRRRDGTEAEPYTLPSAWRFFNSHPEKSQVGQSAHPEVRQHVAIDERTGAAADRALFDVEILPRGVAWPFLLEVDTARAPHAEGLARAALREWQAGRCWLGRETARGLGWLTLEGLEVYRLTRDHIERWPNARESGDYHAYVREEFRHSKCEEITPLDAEIVRQPRPLFEITGKIVAGRRSDGYGIDSLSVGGHAREQLATVWNDAFLAPTGMDREPLRAWFEPDFSIATHPSGGTRVPFVPGSSLRGPLRHAASRLVRADPGRRDRGLIESLFGMVEERAAPGKAPAIGGKLLIRDAWPEDGQWALAWLQMHAEDEFTAGAFSTAKFDRVALIEGAFSWKMVLDSPTVEECGLLRDVLALAETGQIGVGGGQWRGHGWGRWEVDGWTRMR